MKKAAASRRTIEPTPYMLIRLLLAMAVAALPMLIAGVSGADAPLRPSTRPFRMGFTRWPSDLSVEGIQTAQSFAYAHGDMVSVMFIGGIPWPEALEGKPFSQDVQSNLDYRPPGGTKLFLSISPLNKDRTDLAPYWGQKDKDQAGEVADLMKQSDLFAMSIYPHMSYSVPRPIPSGLLDFARAFEKPIAVAESGMTSRDVELKAFELILRGLEADQRQFTELFPTN